MNYLFEFKKMGIGTHKQEYVINEELFESFDYYEIKKAKLKIEAIAEIKTSSISFNFLTKGYVNVECDVCLEPFDFKIQNKNTLFVRFSERQEFGEDNFEDENKMTLSKTVDTIDLKKHFYDFILLSLPIKKVHPLDENGNKTCNPDFLAKLNEYQNTVKNNPIREQLNKLNINNK